MGEPERVEFDGGKYNLVYRNKDKIVIREEEYAVGILLRSKEIDSYYLNGQEGAVGLRYPLSDGGTREEEILYDRFGNPIKRDTLFYDKDGKRDRSRIREKWNRETKRWEPVLEDESYNLGRGTWERQRFNKETRQYEFFNPETGKWERLRFNEVTGHLEFFNPETEKWERFNAKTGEREEVPPSTAPPPSDATENRAAPDNARATLDSMDGIKRSTSASPGYGAESTVANGLSVATFTAPQGMIYVNLPSDMAAGDTLFGTVVAEPKGEDPKTRTRNQQELSEYVVELGQQKSTISAGRVLKLALPSAISTTTYLILRDRKGKEVCRSEVPVASSLPTIVDFTLPVLGQHGSAVEIRGSFDGNLDTTRVRISGQDVQLLAESPRRLIARNTSERVGLNEIEIREGDQVRRGPFRSLGIRLSAPKLDLLRGEQTTLTVTVLGLEGIKAPVPLVLENKSPGIISMGSANIERITISPSQVQGGIYTTQRPLTGIQRGTFTIVGTVGTDGNESGRVISVFIETAAHFPRLQNCEFRLDSLIHTVASALRKSVTHISQELFQRFPHLSRGKPLERFDASGSCLAPG